jgi:hypothetical protein
VQQTGRQLLAGAVWTTHRHHHPINNRGLIPLLTAVAMWHTPHPTPSPALRLNTLHLLGAGFVGGKSSAGGQCSWDMQINTGRRSLVRSLPSPSQVHASKQGQGHSEPLTATTIPTDTPACPSWPARGMWNTPHPMTAPSTEAGGAWRFQGGGCGLEGQGRRGSAARHASIQGRAQSEPLTATTIPTNTPACPSWPAHGCVTPHPVTVPSLLAGGAWRFQGGGGGLKRQGRRGSAAILNIAYVLILCPGGSHCSQCFPRTYLTVAAPRGMVMSKQPRVCIGHLVQRRRTARQQSCRTWWQQATSSIKMLSLCSNYTKRLKPAGLQS